MSEFKGRHFRGEIVLWAVRWYCRYAVSYAYAATALDIAMREGHDNAADALRDA